MPNAKLPEHPLVESFLRSEEKSFTYSGNFQSRRDLRLFMRNYRDKEGWFQDRGFSCDMKEQAGLKVFIDKTRPSNVDRDVRHANLSKRRNEQDEEERAAIEPILDQLEKIDLNKKFDGETSSCIKCPECDNWVKNSKG